MDTLKIIKDVLSEDISPVGMLDSGETFGLEQEDRKGNMYVLGKSSQGKTMLLENIIISDLVNLRAGLLIDPFGDIVDDTAQYTSKENVIIFEVEKGDSQSNIDKFKKEVNLSELKNGKFIMCKLSYPIVGSHVAREVGQYILDEFYKLDALKDVSLYIDEFHNFVDKGINISKNKEKGVKCTLADQAIFSYSDEGLKQLFNVVDHIVSYNVDKRTAKKVAENFGMDASSLTSVEQYHYYARLIVGGEKTDTIKARGVFPIPYSKK